MDALDPLRPGGMGDGAEAGNKARRLGVSSQRSEAEIDEQLTGVTDVGVASLLENEPFRAIRRDRTRLSRANFRDFCRSFSKAEHMDVKEIPMGFK